MQYFVYIIYSKYRDKYYIGQSEDPSKRLEDNNTGRSKYTSVAKDWRVVYSEQFDTRQEAIQRENQIKKKKSRKYVEFLIELNHKDLICLNSPK